MENNAYWLHRTGHTERECYNAFVRTLDGYESDHCEDALASFVECVYAFEGSNKLAEIGEDHDLDSLDNTVDNLEDALLRKDHGAIKKYIEDIEEWQNMPLFEAIGAVAEYRATQYQAEVPMSFRAWLHATGRTREAVELIRAFTKWGVKHTQNILEGGNGFDEEKPGLLGLLGDYEDTCQREGITPEDMYIAVGRFSVDAVRYLWALG